MLTMLYFKRMAESELKKWWLKSEKLRNLLKFIFAVYLIAVVMLLIAFVVCYFIKCVINTC